MSTTSSISQMSSTATSIGSNACSSICQMPTNATDIGANSGSRICQMSESATSIGGKTCFIASSNATTNISHMVVHTKHNGCYESCQHDEFGPVTVLLNPPAIYLFNGIEKATQFFDDYIYNMKCTHPNCVKPSDDDDDDDKYVDDCGVIQTDENDNVCCYHDHTNQIYILECGSQLFASSATKNISQINKLKRQKKSVKSFSQQKKEEMIEIGKMCEKSM